MNNLSPEFTQTIQVINSKYQPIFEKVNKALQEAHAKLKIDTLMDANTVTQAAQRQQARDRLQQFEAHLVKIKSVTDNQIQHYSDDLKHSAEQLPLAQREAFLGDAMQAINTKNDQRYLEHHVQLQWLQLLRGLLNFFEQHGENIQLANNQLNFKEPEVLAMYKVQLYQIHSLAKLAQQFSKTPAEQTAPAPTIH